METVSYRKFVVLQVCNCAQVLPKHSLETLFTIS